LVLKARGVDKAPEREPEDAPRVIVGLVLGTSEIPEEDRAKLRDLGVDV
jgi:hypothetical protein